MTKHPTHRIHQHSREVSKTVCETTGRKVRCVFYAWVLRGDA